jgi:hypothetical protein
MPSIKYVPYDYQLEDEHHKVKFMFFLEVLEEYEDYKLYKKQLMSKLDFDMIEKNRFAS